MKNNEEFSQIEESSAIVYFVFANSIEKATRVTFFWHLSRSLDKRFLINRRKNAKFDTKNEIHRKFNSFLREKRLTIFG